MSEDRVDEYGYNIRNELISAAKNAEGAKELEYAYRYDDIGNRITSLDLGTNRTYVANNLNQYTSISNSALSVSPRVEFIPQFDDDGNQTLIQTVTGIWSATYNGENRPILWQCVSTDSLTPNSSTPPFISMSYDRMGRRVTKNNQRFIYDGYLQIADNGGNVYIWDPTEKVATRPLVWRNGDVVAFYTHDGNKNVSEVISDEAEVDAHYEYAPFGVIVVKHGVFAADNPWRFSSEYAEDDTSTVYYNYRYYEPVTGRWLSRDPEGEVADLNLRCMLSNIAINGFDYLGLSLVRPNKDGTCPKKCCGGKMIQLVPIWHCIRKLGGTGATSLWLLNHQYICCDNSNLSCFGVQKYIPSCMKNALQLSIKSRKGNAKQNAKRRKVVS